MLVIGFHTQSLPLLLHLSLSYSQINPYLFIAKKSLQIFFPILSYDLFMMSILPWLALGSRPAEKLHLMVNDSGTKTNCPLLIHRWVHTHTHGFTFVGRLTKFISKSVVNVCVTHAKMAQIEQIGRITGRYARNLSNTPNKALRRCSALRGYLKTNNCAF